MLTRWKDCYISVMMALTMSFIMLVSDGQMVSSAASVRKVTNSFVYTVDCFVGLILYLFFVLNLTTDWIDNGDKMNYFFTGSVTG